MNAFKLTAGFILAGVILTTKFVSPVLAQELTQEQRQKLEQELNIELECTTGAYGQPQTCKAKGTSSLTAEQEQKARLVLGDKVVIRDGAFYYHRPVDTAMNSKTLSMFALVLVAGLAGAAYQVKNKIS
jgi:hypothetical protein